jgi:glutamate--cysteine ligase
VFDALRARVHERCFAPSADDGLPRIGAEVEFLALDALSRGPVPVHALDRGLLALLRRHARIAAWTESRSAYGTPQFVVAGRATVSFEPGGQIEIATVACASASTLIEALETVVAPLRVSLAREGVTLVSKGIDPCTAIAEVELQLRVDRYERMTRYFDRIGPFGARMMRQTAAVQISVDRGPDPAARWRLLNDVAPYLVALFANSTHYAGADTGHRSYRSHCWRMLDASRTGVAAPSDDPAAEYTRFALGAADMMRLTRDGEYRSFGDWAAVGKWTIDGWERHLTTLFPEVRPRGHFELRSCDAVDPAFYPALVVFVCGLVYDDEAAREAARLATGSDGLLVLAGERGLGDERIARTARSLFALALEGAVRVGPRYIAPDDVEWAREVYRDLTARGMSPGTYLPSGITSRRTPASAHVI